jgi:2-dehydro-3-deoxygluconokinase
LNVCAAAAALGARTGFASRVGDDPLGGRVRAAATALGVDTGLLATTTAAPTGVFFKDVRPDGQRRVYYYRAGSAASTMDASDARRVLACRPGTVVVSGITASLGAGPHRAVTELLHSARDAGVRVALDPNLRPALGPVPEQVARLLPLLPYVDTLLLGTDEAPHLLGHTEPAGIFAAASAAGVGETVLKAGPDGCWVEVAGQPRHLPTAATAVLDPVGAGDAFAGGYLVGRARGLSVFGAAWLGTQLAARVVAHVGDTTGLPDPEQAAALLREAGTQLP